MQADVFALGTALERQVEMYRFTHFKEPSITAIAQLLSTILYSRRFFPYYTFNILTGIDENGNGVTFGFDAVGNYGKEPYVANGTGGNLIMSILDNQLGGKNQLLKPQVETLEQLVNVVKGALVSAAERDIYTGLFWEFFFNCKGDSAEIVIFDRVATQPIQIQLRKD
ncbi:bifunctional Proteasome [Babesia duncani]|uniref:Bifunctional Proteasome n=1 Tax=Babesia duncani TaxID=323732 RepID=A0AAD9UQU3_9APIC|nr:bifunctional Proteasome [Babesia duncani]